MYIVNISSLVWVRSLSFFRVISGCHASLCRKRFASALFFATMAVAWRQTGAGLPVRSETSDRPRICPIVQSLFKLINRIWPNGSQSNHTGSEGHHRPESQASGWEWTQPGQWTIWRSFFGKQKHQKTRDAFSEYAFEGPDFNAYDRIMLNLSDWVTI